MRAALIALPRWVRYLTTVGVVADIVVAGAGALGPGHHAIGGAVGGPLGALCFNFYRNRDFDRLPRPERLRVLAAMRTGTPTGDGRLDAIARRRLRQAARSYRSDRVLMPIITAIMVACPVIAAVRRGSAWWLLLLVPMALTLLCFPLSDPRPRLAAFDVAATAG